MASTKKEILLITRYPFQLFYWFICPFFMILKFYTTAQMFGGLGGRLLELERLTGNYATYVSVGTMISILFGHTIWQVGYYLRREQLSGTLEVNFLLPINPVTLVLGKTLAFDLIFCLYIPFILLLSWLFLGLQISGSIILALVTLVLSIVSAFGLGLLFSSLTFVFRRISRITALYVSFMYLFSGRSYPISILPIWLRIVPYFFPITWSLDAIRAVLVFNSEEIWPTMAGSTIFSIILIMVGYFTFKIMLKTVKKRGGLGGY